MQNLVTEVKLYQNVPIIFVNGEPVSGLMHWNRNMEPEDVRNFAEAGVHFFSFLGNIDLKDGATDRVDDGRPFCHTMTPDYIDSVMTKILGADPEALIIPRFRLQASEIWKANHPNSLTQSYHFELNEYDDVKMTSLGIDEWIDDALNGLARSIEHCENRWGDHIAGYHSGFGDCAEHVYAWGSRIADYHPEMLKKFKHWLKYKYKTEEMLCDAWQIAEITFDQIEFPNPENYAKISPGLSCLLNPQHEQQLIDMMEFNSDYMAGLVVKQACKAKETLSKLKKKKIFGVFYGYMNLPANEIAHCAHGHDAHEKVLTCPELDFISAPVGYSARQPGGVSTGQLAPASVQLAGKLYFAEDDSGTNLTANKHNTMPGTAEQASQILTRGFLDVWRSGGTQWFMDLHGEGEYRDAELMSTIGKLTDFAQKHIHDRESCAEIVVFFSDKSLNYSKTLNVFSGNLLEQQLNEICSIGASFDVFRIEDLPELVRQNRLKKYKLAIMLNLHSVSDPLREDIENYLKKDKRTLLWFHAPGIIYHGKFSVEQSNALTGINCVMQEKGRLSLITEVLIEGKRFSYGTQRNIYPRLIAADPCAETLGYLVEGTTIPFRQDSDGGMFVKKAFPDYCAMWSGSPNMPSGLLTIIAKDAGVHIYCKCGSQMFNTNNWVGVHAKWTGELILKFPQKLTFTDASTGEIVVNNEDYFRRTVVRGQNILLEMVQ